MSGYPSCGIANYAYSRALDDHPNSETDADEVGLAFLSHAVVTAFNPPGDDVAFESILATAIERAALFIQGLPCECGPGDDDPCGRCSVLGRHHDEWVERS